MVSLKSYLWGHRWNILLTTQFIFTCGIVANRYQQNHAKPEELPSRPQSKAFSDGPVNN